MNHKIPPEKYYESLNKTPFSSGILFLNEKEEFLILKTTYKNGWSIVGGMSEKGESPIETAIRETREEIGLDIKDPRMFAVDFHKSDPYDRFLFLFDGGTLFEKEIGQIVLQKEEISDFKFATKEEMLNLLTPRTREKVKNSLGAFFSENIIYLENGKNTQDPALR